MAIDEDALIHSYEDFYGEPFISASQWRELVNYPNARLYGLDTLIPHVVLDILQRLEKLENNDGD